MRLVAVDTSTRWCDVAVLVGHAEKQSAGIVATAGVHAHDSHSARLLQLIERALESAGWRREDVDAWAAARGPGSFTGLRIGLGTVRGLALASGRPCIGIGTLVALATAHGPAEVDRVPVLDAGRGEVYAARFDPSSDPPREIEAPWVCAPAELFSRVGGGAVVFGPGTASLGAAGFGSRGSRMAAAPAAVAAAVGRLAVARLHAGCPDGEGMAPLYVRPPDAVARPRGS